MSRLLAVRRAVLAAAILLAARQTHAASRALLVGLDTYPFIHDSYDQLHGAATDLKQMRAVLEYGHCAVQELRGSAATGAAIRKGLQALADSAREGDEILFYFSGRGSIAPPASAPRATKEMEPTLVPYDGQPKSAARDVRMSAVEVWAQQVVRSKATPVIVLDTCYVRPPLRGEDRYYKNVPRCVSRPGVPRKQLYRGPGILLAACGSEGSAYEWRVDFSSNTWAGAFSDELSNVAMTALVQKQAPTYRSLLEEVRKRFASRPGYMPGLRPYPDRPGLTQLFDRPLLSSGSPMLSGPPPPPPPPVAAQAAGMVDALRRKEQTLRVGLDAPPGREDAERKKLLAQAGPAWQTFLSKRLPEAALVPQYGDRPDRIISLSRVGRVWHARVAGDEVDEFRKAEYSGTDVPSLMSAGLADYLRRQAYVLRLFRMAASGSGTLPVDWSIAPEQPRYRRGELFHVQVDTPTGGYLYLLDQDDADGVVQLVWPAPAEPRNVLPPGKSRLPRQEFEVNGATPLGHTLVRAILVSVDQLPPLEPTVGAGWVSGSGAVDPRYSKTELAHLQALLKAIRIGTARWSARTFTYEVSE